MPAPIVLSLMEWDLFSPPEWVGAATVQLGKTDLVLEVALEHCVLHVSERAAYADGGPRYSHDAKPAAAWAVCLSHLLLPARSHACGGECGALVLDPQPDVGLANALLRMLGLPESQWLWSPTSSKPTFVLMSLWGIGNTMVIFLAGLQGIPQSLLRDAEIDGPTAGTVSGP